jgi:hypothetical protein
MNIPDWMEEELILEEGYVLNNGILPWHVIASALSKTADLETVFFARLKKLIDFLNAEASGHVRFRADGAVVQYSMNNLWWSSSIDGRSFRED